MVPAGAALCPSQPYRVLDPDLPGWLQELGREVNCSQVSISNVHIQLWFADRSRQERLRQQVFVVCCVSECPSRMDSTWEFQGKCLGAPADSSQLLPAQQRFPNPLPKDRCPLLVGNK